MLLPPTKGRRKGTCQFGTQLLIILIGWIECGSIDQRYQSTSMWTGEVTLSDKSTLWPKNERGTLFLGCALVGLDTQQSDPWVLRLNYGTCQLEGERAAPSVGRHQKCRHDMVIHHAPTLTSTSNDLYRGVDQFMEENETSPLGSAREQ